MMIQPPRGCVGSAQPAGPCRPTGRGGSPLGSRHHCRPGQRAWHPSRQGLCRGPPESYGERSLDRATTTGSRLRTFTSMEATIEVTGLRKRFGPAVALDGISFSVALGQVTGFVGPNGAGKTTTMRVILGLDAADEGSALIDGQPYAALRHPLSRVGSLLDAGALHPSRTARNH